MLMVRHGQSEFNAHFNLTRRDPGIRDPDLTDEGRAQARTAAKIIADHGSVREIWSSPYRRALQTAEIIAERLRGQIHTITPLVGERAAYFCDYGSAPQVLQESFPYLRFDHLAPQWWPDHEEPVSALQRRAARFVAETAAHVARDGLLIVSHWGFIQAVTGLPVGNCSVVKVPVNPSAATVVHAT
jgi:glucosyl-3-phosphoglycerate phosphatase